MCPLAEQTTGAKSSSNLESITLKLKMKKLLLGKLWQVCKLCRKKNHFQEMLTDIVIAKNKGIRSKIPFA